MRILIIGSERNREEVSARLGASHKLEFRDSPPEDGAEADVLFDFRIHQRPEDCRLYGHMRYVFLNTVCTTLDRLRLDYGSNIAGHWFGFNGLPTFFSAGELEVCVTDKASLSALETVCASLPIGFTLVRDQVGMVTPRIITMIINEAYYTYAEGTASRADIDLAMKLGTNYPYGPFEWCDRIGASEVCEVLTAIGGGRDPRYKICPDLLKEGGANRCVAG